MINVSSARSSLLQAVRVRAAQERLTSLYPRTVDVTLAGASLLACPPSCMPIAPAGLPTRLPASLRGDPHRGFIEERIYCIAAGGAVAKVPGAFIVNKCHVNGSTNTVAVCSYVQ
jgi:hypothetical protein